MLVRRFVMPPITVLHPRSELFSTWCKAYSPALESRGRVTQNHEPLELGPAYCSTQSNTTPRSVDEDFADWHSSGAEMTFML